MVVTLDKILDAQEPVLASAFATMVRQIRDRYTLGQIESFLAAGRVEQALETALRFAPRIGDAYIESYISAGQDVARQINIELPKIEVRFDIVNQRAVNEMQRNRLRLVQEFTNEQRMATRQALTRGVRQGLNPREQARAFRDSIGLTRRQEQSVANYRRMLEQNDRDALRRALRDKRYDRSVQSAIDSGRRLPQGRIDRMVERYRERMVKYRSEVIARTEALRSVHQGSEQMFDQAIEGGQLQSDQLQREWNTALDERVRGSHAAMHGQVQPMGVPFLSGLGNQLMYPGDPSAPPEDTIQCRCSVGTRVTDAAAITDADIGIEVIGI
jgi:uncharacterized protein with gpF-like domain